MKKLISVVLAVVILAAAVTVGLTVFATEGEGTSGTSPESSSTDPGSTEPTEETVYTPDSITGLEAVSVTDTTVSLRWNRSNYATKYLVYRAVESNTGTVGDYKKIASIQGKKNTGLKGSGLKPGRVYKYKVYACRVKNGITTKGDPASVVIMTTPESVRTFKATDRSVDSVTLTWNKVDLSTKYLIYRAGQKEDKTYSSYKIIKKITDASTTSFKDTKLGSGKFFKYKIVVKRVKAGISKTSAAKSLKVMTVLSTPSNFRNKSATAKSITVAWNKVTRADKYELYRKSSGGSFEKIKTVKGISYKDKAVSSGENYTYKVRAVRRAGGKNYYSKFAKLSSSTAVIGVSGIKTKSVLSRALITWNSVSDADGYDVFLQSGDDFKYKASTVYPRYLSGKLKAGKVYTFAVKAYKSIGGDKVYGTTKTAKVKISSTAYGSKPSGTWVEVCTETQTLYMYVKNKLYLSTPVVTGNQGALETTRGYHHVLSKSANTQLRGSYGGSSWDTFVNYWLGFTSDGQGIHDAPWRSDYGGDIYKGNGSHGCVNTPYDKMSKVFAKAFTGMPVIVY